MRLLAGSKGYTTTNDGAWDIINEVSSNPAKCVLPGRCGPKVYWNIYSEDGHCVGCGAKQDLPNLTRNPGSGNSQQFTILPATVKPVINNPDWQFTTRGCTPCHGCATLPVPGDNSIRACRCGVTYTNELLNIWWDQHESATLPVVPKTSADDAEQKLLDKVIKPFAGEALCDIRAHNEHLKEAPILPWFDKGEDAVSHESRRKMKRWVSTNMRTWPLCNHSQQPLDLVFDGSYLPDGHGGQFCDPSFFCQYCDSKARR